MVLLVTLGRGTYELPLGKFAAVELAHDELRTRDGRSLARHRHNRWIDANGGEAYHRVDIIGPLILSGPAGKARADLGPYLNFSTFDGVGYVDRRVICFSDVEQRDWYVMDVGAHWQSITISFHSSDAQPR